MLRGVNFRYDEWVPGQPILTIRAFLVALAFATMPLAVGWAAPDALVYARLGSYLEALRVQAGIPGMSAAIVGETDIVWERGFGRQDLDRAIPALPDTPFHLDGLGQTLTATLVLQCVEQGKVSLDDGSAVSGFLCEAHALAGAEEITSFGGWRAFIAEKAR